ncbi:hypothetical protein CBR_g18899 [Chara braunii]|uniref:DDE Tnp4 domain-containing protein n=1 Tax=Chara braunii TaxID=69332 RepID=A0A388KWR5_CHABU|nr:hypothetical protein CBR_g18899 [Chara braunii]|eukprot:GBG74489.1 hypothetical protein CBR_g18899 [Chara braunii]
MQRGSSRPCTSSLPRSDVHHRESNSIGVWHGGEVPCTVMHGSAEAVTRRELSYREKGLLVSALTMVCRHMESTAELRRRASIRRRNTEDGGGHETGDGGAGDLRCSVGRTFPDGECHHCRVLWNSSLFKRAGAVTLFEVEPIVLPGGVSTKGYLLGDNGYDPKTWIVVPYGGVEQQSDVAIFYGKQKATGGVVERAFGRLKGMWRLFLRHHKTNTANMPQQFHDVCILHNLLIEAGIDFDERVLLELDADGNEGMVDLGMSRLKKLWRKSRFNGETHGEDRGEVLPDDGEGTRSSSWVEEEGEGEAGSSEGGRGRRQLAGSPAMAPRHELNGVLDVTHRWDAGVRERRWENVVVLSDEVTNCGLQVSCISCEFLSVSVSSRRRGGLDGRRRDGSRDGSHGDRGRSGSRGMSSASGQGGS